MTKHLALIGLLLVAMLTGCSHDESTEAVDSKQTNVSADFVSADEATTIAEAIQFGSTEATTADGKATTRSAGLNKEVQSVTPVPDASGVTAFYVINYKGGGFMLLAADKRVTPVLAYSETSTFPMNDPEGFPEGLVDWMSDVKEHVKAVRTKNEPPTEATKVAWGSLLQTVSRTTVKAGNQPLSEDKSLRHFHFPMQEIVSPLLKTTWNQGDGYNAMMPEMNCAKSFYNGRAPAGCVNIAMAQIMKYHRHPPFNKSYQKYKSYNWNAMPDNYATKETAILIKDIGEAMVTTYACKGSGASIDDRASMVFYQFGYTDTKIDAYDINVVKSELRKKRPVILVAGSSDGDSHAWVCDGYGVSKVYGDKFGPVLEVFQYLHMNWGYREKYESWYLYDEAWKSTKIYDRNKKMAYGISPRKKR